MKFNETLKRCFPLTIILVLILCQSCSKDNDDPIDCTLGFGYSAELTDEIATLGNASVAYSEDPSTENCQAYVAAIRDYIDELGRYEDCARQVGELAEFRESLKDAEEDLADIECQ